MADFSSKLIWKIIENLFVKKEHHKIRTIILQTQLYHRTNLINTLPLYLRVDSLTEIYFYYLLENSLLSFIDLQNFFDFIITSNNLLQIYKLLVIAHQKDNNGEIKYYCINNIDQKLLKIFCYLISSEFLQLLIQQ